MSTMIDSDRMTSAALLSYTWKENSLRTRLLMQMPDGTEDRQSILEAIIVPLPPKAATNHF